MYAAVSDAPEPPAPLQPIRMQLNGVRLRRNPRRALLISQQIHLIQLGAILHWRRVTEHLSQITLDIVLWREVQLLEEFGRDGNAASCPDSIQGSAMVHAVVEVVCTVAEVLLERTSVGTVVRHDERYVELKREKES